MGLVIGLCIISLSQYFGEIHWSSSGEEPQKHCRCCTGNPYPLPQLESNSEEQVRVGVRVRARVDGVADACCDRGTKYVICQSLYCLSMVAGTPQPY